MATTTIDLSSLDGRNGFRLDGEAANDSSGFSVSNAGDINGDGFDDVIVGAYAADPNGISNSGASYVVFGKASGFDATLNLSSLDGNNGFRLDGGESAFLGDSVSNAGDVNGDSFDDLIVGSASASPNGTWSGSSYVVFGKDSGFDATMNLSNLDGSNGFRMDGMAAGDHSGGSVSSAGDINGDGFDDLIIGASSADSNGYGSGSSYVVFGKASGFDATLALSSLDGINGFRLDGESENDYSGRSVSNAGDINGDGFDDVIVGAPSSNPNGSDHTGSSYVVFGNNSGFNATLDLSSLSGSNGFRLDGETEDDHSGFSVSNAEDINDDGFNDLIVGAYLASPNGNTEGASYVVFGKDSGFDATMNLSNLDGSNGFRMDGVAASDSSGVSVSNAGDVNGDGSDDLIIGAPQADPNGISNTGSSYIVFGKAAGFDATIDLSSLDSNSGFRLDGTSEVDISGSSVSTADDVNGDGFDDVIIGADGADLNGVSSGSSYVVFGRSDFTDFNMVEGTLGDDILVGSGGNDTFSGNDGNDTIDGGIGNDILTGGLGNDILLSGFGEDQLLGNEGNDIFGFYAPGHFEIQDLNLAEDRIYFGVAQTELSNIDEVNQMITAVNQREDGVEVEFGPNSSIDLIGINFAEITAEMVGFA